MGLVLGPGASLQFNTTLFLNHFIMRKCGTTGGTNHCCCSTGVEVHVPEGTSPYEPLYTVPAWDEDENDTISVRISG